MPDYAQLLLQNLAISTVLFVLLWLVNLATRDPSFIDSWWGLGMVVDAWASFLFVGGVGPHALALTVLCSVWGVRLGSYLLWRWRRHGPDRRYATMMALAQKERGWGYAKASLLLVFALQLPLQMIVSLPVQVGQLGESQHLGPVAWAGIALAVFGILFESIGDFQLVAFKANPANAGKVLQSGLWRYTRHPNYFGDACAWWGLYLIAAETTAGLFAIPGPLLLTWTLMKWSGAPTLERKLSKTRPDYVEYIRRTSGFFPLPPKA